MEKFISNMIIHSSVYNFIYNTFTTLLTLHGIINTSFISALTIERL
jgi:hypothetical protein